MGKGGESLKKMPQGQYQRTLENNCLEIRSFNQKSTIKGESLELTLLGWERNKEFKCPSACPHVEANEFCALKSKQISINPSPKHLRCSILKVQVKNISPQVLGVDFADMFSLIMDSQGNTYDNSMWRLCDTLLPRGWQAVGCELHNDTQGTFYLVWPEMEDDMDITRFLYKQYICKPSKTSGWVQGLEIYDFKLIEPDDIEVTL